MARCAIYARVSTAEQSTENQVTTLLTYAVDRGFEVVEVLEEQASGAEKKRPQLARLMDLARKRKIDAVFVWRLDRFGRSLSHLVQLLEELRELGVNFCSYSDSIDLSTSQGRLQANLLGSMAEFERELIRERVKAGMAAAKAKGKRFGKQPVDHSRREMARILREGGSSYAEIAKETGLSLGSVSKFVRDLKPPKRRKRAGRPPVEAETRQTLRQYRNKGFTIRECAEIAGCSPGTAQKYLSGKPPRKQPKAPLPAVLQRFLDGETPNLKHIHPIVYEREHQQG